MNALVAYSINNHHFLLSPERVIFWEDQKTLIIADLHIGKTGHFRKSGIAVPQKVYREDLQRLFTQILQYKAERLVIVGDLTHSGNNKEIELFSKWRKDLAALHITLVNGNHDILDEQVYRDMSIERRQELQIGSFSFVHDPAEVLKPAIINGHYTFCGHLHPSVHIKGRGRQVLQFPCFYFAGYFGVLPAFSRFTGMHAVKPEKNDHVFAIIENGLVQMQ